MTYEIHPAAILGPLDEGVVKDLVGRMTRFGYSKAEPILLYEGKIIDGRHRYESSRRAKVTPVFSDLVLSDGQTPQEWVLERHHMREISTLMKKIYVVEAFPEKTMAQLRSLLGMKPGAGGATDSLVVLRRAHSKRPDLLQKIKNKKLSVSNAAVALGMDYASGSQKAYQITAQLRDEVTKLTMLREADAKVIKGLQADLRAMDDLKAQVTALTQEVEELTEDLSAAEAELAELRTTTMVTA